MTDGTEEKHTVLKGWRTLALSLGIAVVGVLQAADWAELVPERAIGPVMVAIAMAVAALRVLTDTPIGRK